MKAVALLALLQVLMSSARAAPVLPVPYAGAAPSMDGNDASTAWRSAALIPSLTLSLGPDAKGLRALPTAVAIQWDQKNLYFQFTCADELAQPGARRSDEPLYKGPVVEVFLDAAGASRVYSELQVSPGNQTFDQQISLDTSPVSDSTGKLVDMITMHHYHANAAWHITGLRTATRRIPGGWVAWIAIPPQSYGLSAWRPMTVRANLLRYDWTPAAPGKGTLIAMNWAPVVYGCPHISPQAMGYLKLLPRK